MTAGRELDLLLGRERLPRRLQLSFAAEISTTYVHVRWLVWRRDIRSVVAALRGDIDECVSPSEPARLGQRLAWPIRRTLDRLPFDSRCLMRSLVLIRMLARRGVQGTLVIGVLGDDAFSAHAWVEHGDVPLLPIRGHAPIARI